MYNYIFAQNMEEIFNLYEKHFKEIADEILEQDLFQNTSGHWKIVPPWNKNLIYKTGIKRNHSKETKLKIAKSVSEYRKDNPIDYNEDVREKLSRAAIQRHKNNPLIFTDEYRKKLSESQKKRKPISEETRNKMRESARKRWKKSKS